MENDVFKGKWKQLRGQTKIWWSKLNDDDLKKVDGNFDIFVGLLQEKYGYSHQHAVEEINKRLTDINANLKKNIKATPKKGS